METVFPADGGEAQTSPDATTGGMRFKVETVVESPTRSVPSLGSSPSVDGAGLSTADAANRTVGTIGYSTAEAVPMTMFYRNQESTNRGKARPTLAELHHDTVDNEVSRERSFYFRFDIYIGVDITEVKIVQEYLCFDAASHFHESRRLSTLLRGMTIIIFIIKEK